MNVLVVDDNSPFRIFLRKVLLNAGYNVFLAEDGNQAWSVIENQKLDAVITDWMMPNMDGIELVKKIRQHFSFPPIIIIVTALVLKEAFDKAMEVGADDYLPKPVAKEVLLHSLEECLSRRGQEPIQAEPEVSFKKEIPDFYGVAIAASTGGPVTLMNLLSSLPDTDKAAFFVVLHGPGWMLKSFADRCNQNSLLPIHLADHNLKIEPGNVYLAPGDIHMVIDKDEMKIKLDNSPPENFVRPAADPLFRSVAAKFGSKSVAIVLTGMGRDGTIGSGYIKTAGGLVITQDPATAIINSMPKSVIDLRISDKTTKIENIPSILEEHFRESKQVDG